MKIDLHLPSGKYILLKTPDNSTDFSYDKHRGCISGIIRHSVDDGFDKDWFSDKIEGNYELIGPVSSITEEQLREIIPTIYKYRVKQKLNQQPQYDTFWIDVSGKSIYFDKKEQAYDWARRNEFSDLLKANRIYSDNPYGEKPDYEEYDGDDDCFDDDMKKWSEAQQRTGNWVLLKLLK